MVDVWDYGPDNTSRTICELWLRLWREKVDDYMLGAMCIDVVVASCNTLALAAAYH